VYVHLEKLTAHPTASQSTTGGDVTETLQPPPLLARVGEAATALACSEAQIRKYLADGTLPIVRIGNGVRTTWAAIHAFVQNGAAA
jgi:excisionase family DNA binding protein